MSRVILGQSKDGHHTATVSQSVQINSPYSNVWREISNIAGLAGWVVGVKKTEFLSKTKRGTGAGRRIHFEDGGKVIEYVTGWENGKYLSYIATEGLPLDGYHATLSLSVRGRGSQLTWGSFMISKGSGRKEFEDFVDFIDNFYRDSLRNLKGQIEKTT